MTAEASAPVPASLNQQDLTELVVAAFVSGDVEASRAALKELREHLDELPAGLREALAAGDPDAKGEARLSYASKMPIGQVRGISPVPLQQVSSFGDVGGSDWHNRLIFGDNLGVLAELVRMKHRGQLKNADGTDGVRLCYIDPPFATEREFTTTTGQVAYRDKVAGSDFIEFLRRRLILVRELLSDDGTLWVHLDEKKSHYIKVVLDEVFGASCFMNEVVWAYTGPSPVKRYFPKKHDTLLVYSKTAKGQIFNVDAVRVPYDESTLKRRAAGESSNTSMRFAGRELESYAAGKVPADWWADIPAGGQISRSERSGYPTEKPKKLLERVITASSNPGDLVLDCFMGSGSTLRVADRLGRRWVGVDAGKLSVHTATRELVKQSAALGDNRPGFAIYHAGLYDPDRLAAMDYGTWVGFTLDLFDAQHRSENRGGVAFHGRFGRSELIHVVDPARDRVLGQPTTSGRHVIGLDYLRDLVRAVKPGPRTKLAVIVPDGLAPALRENVYAIDWTYSGQASTSQVRLLKVPPSITSEFLALAQAGNKDEVNAIIESHGFDIAQPPEVTLALKTIRKAPVVELTRFESNAIVRARKDHPSAAPADPRGDLALVLIDYAYDKDVFDFDDHKYGDDVAQGNWRITLRPEALEAATGLILVDRFGNEARLVITPDQFEGAR